MGVQQPVKSRGRQSAEAINDQEQPTPAAVFDQTSDDPQEYHVSEQMAEATVEKGGGQPRFQPGTGRSEAVVPGNDFLFQMTIFPAQIQMVLLLKGIGVRQLALLKQIHKGCVIFDPGEQCHPGR